MPERSNQNLDEFFQQGSEKYDFEYKPLAWAQMEALLDREKRRRMVWWWFGAGALLIVVILLAWLFSHQPEQAKNGPSSVADSSLEPAPLSAQPAKRYEREQHRPSGLDMATGRAPSGKRPAQGAKKESANAEQTITSRRTAGAESAPTAQSGAKTTIDNMPVAHKSSKKDDRAGETAARPELALGTLQALPLAPLKQLSGPQRAEEHLTALVQWATDVNPPAPHLKNRLAFGPGFALALNSTGWGNFSGTAWKAGGVLEYQYASRYALSLGLLYQHMNYYAEKGEYIPPKGFWTRKIAPEETEGQCTVVEVPVLLKYHFRAFNSSGLFASAGFTSFILLEEHYHYSYELPDPDLIRYWMTDEDSQHWFATGHFSLGYQAMLGPKLALQAAPYLQAPLSGIGHGKVKMYSVGIDLRVIMGR